MPCADICLASVGQTVPSKGFPRGLDTSVTLGLPGQPVALPQSPPVSASLLTSQQGQGASTRFPQFTGSDHNTSRRGEAQPAGSSSQAAVLLLVNLDGRRILAVPQVS